MVVGLGLLSMMDAHTSRLAASASMFVLGLGLGLVMQVLVLAVQNAVDYRDLAVATSGATLFRSIGGSVGTAILGAILLQPAELRAATLLPASARGAEGGQGRLGDGGGFAAEAAPVDVDQPASRSAPGRPPKFQVAYAVMTPPPSEWPPSTTFPPSRLAAETTRRTSPTATVIPQRLAKPTIPGATAAK